VFASAEVGKGKVETVMKTYWWPLSFSGLFFYCAVPVLGSLVFFSSNVWLQKWLEQAERLLAEFQAATINLNGAPSPPSPLSGTARRVIKEAEARVAHTDGQKVQAEACTARQQIQLGEDEES
jgi:hypothetical protein